ncbi:hypothetical protein DPMN_192725 [Dreissena polymorpha]|uniref:Uncharacterized protein n=1 Tax=Dreissena polymorpha TaxID=45954 RepID=A0A9D3Y6V9_DREPO|nr:hypothetical protein DPMN_192725 [Dreissena polymorpha]
MLLGHKQEIRVQTLKEIIQAKETRVQVANESSVLRKQLADREYMLQVECGIIQRRVGKTHSAEFATTASSQAETSHVDSNEPETTESIIPNLFRITVDEKMMEIERHNPLILMEKWREAETNVKKNELKNVLSKCALPEEKQRLQNQLRIKTEQVECLTEQRQILESRCQALHKKIGVLEKSHSTAEEDSLQLRQLTQEDVQLQFDYTIVLEKLQSIGNVSEARSERSSATDQEISSTDQSNEPSKSNETRKLQIE